MKINDLFFNLNLTCNACGKENDNGYFCEKCKKELPFNNVICDKCGRSTINKESRWNIMLNIILNEQMYKNRELVIVPWDTYFRENKITKYFVKIQNI